ncbi:T9SS type A sorting domain-containing protein [Flavobacterium sp. Sd200]|uniref:T9SS type A sorting domain-containing protein n=1 Tax=Flavobacterium sp. Sd200 TaxID=2692211 RepID=UPI00136D6A21|nr:T9SS type A sorting domain-containing protein [Flavobacterium sp. Sd200]MXN90784.1 T9SS type A sorting domain-containing protein [Flavobacterium sp. Sd200]
MKRTLLMLVLFCTTNSFCQIYEPDDSFGIDGSIIHNDVSFYPTDALLVDNSYYFISDNNMVKLNYDGSLATEFGNNGIITLDNSAYNYTISGFKHFESYFYVFGTRQDREEGREDGFICKIDHTGNFDTSFGTNNFAIANFEAQEIINDFVTDQNGNLFCIGTRYDGEVTNSIRLIYFKIDATGQLDATFDNNGFKEVAINNFSNGSFIKTYGNNNFLLVGTDTYFEPITNIRHQKLLTVLIDANGTPLNSYGTDGIRLTELNTGMTNTLKNVDLINNSLYVNYFYSASVFDQGSRIAKYGIDEDQLAFNNVSYYNANFKVTNNGIFVTGAHACPSASDSSCPRDFNLSKMTEEGFADITFNNNTEYTFDFPGDMYSDDVSQALITENDGTVLIGGHSTGIYWDTFYPSGFALIRLKPATMDINTIKNKALKLYPNPFTSTVTITSLSQSVISSVEVYDLTGRSIGKPAFYTHNGTTKVNLEMVQQKGSYVLKATSNDGSVFNNIIIKN